MKVETYYPNIESCQKLNKLLDLPYSGEDWDIVNADDQRVAEFISYYLDAEEVQDKVSLFALLVASMDGLEEDAAIEAALHQISVKMQEHLKYHLSTIIYWALIGEGQAEEELFAMTKYMRNFLCDFMATDKLEIKAPNITGIEFNGLPFSSILKEDQFLKPFPEVLRYFNAQRHPEEEGFEILENTAISVEKEKDFTHFEIWGSGIGCHYLKVTSSDFEKEIKKYIE